MTFVRAGREAGIQYSEFAAQDFPRRAHLWIDGHLNAGGHRQLAAHLAELLN